MDTLSEIGEHDAIRRLTAMLGTHGDLIVGAGDDCAVVGTTGGDSNQVLTTDPVIEGIHFLSADAPERVGNKAAGRVLSDIAAMGARPQWLLADIVAPPHTDVRYLEGVYSGMTALCGRFGAVIIGGDLSQGPHLEIHVFGTGILPAGSALLRSGARVGDAVYVTGSLGCSRQGKHLDFKPRVEEGIYLRETGLVGAMMDISDGLATDLRHILAQSAVGAELEAEQIPRTGTLEQALCDGEDFELLFTVRPEDAQTLIKGWSGRFDEQPVRIGIITDQSGILSMKFADGSSRPLDGKAFEHFRPNPDRD